MVFVLLREFRFRSILSTSLIFASNSTIVAHKLGEIGREIKYIIVIVLVTNIILTSLLFCLSIGPAETETRDYNTVTIRHTYAQVGQSINKLTGFQLIFQ